MQLESATILHVEDDDARARRRAAKPLGQLRFRATLAGPGRRWTEPNAARSGNPS